MSTETKEAFLNGIRRTLEISPSVVYVVPKRGDAARDVRNLRQDVSKVIDRLEQNARKQHVGA